MLISAIFVVTIVISEIFSASVETFKENKTWNLRSTEQISPMIMSVGQVFRTMAFSFARSKPMKFDLMNLLEPFPPNVSFPCDLSEARSAEVPTSVHRLRPGDIDVVGGIGDSLSAGSGALATDVSHMFVEYRGLAWSMGGQWDWRNATTLPNILKVFNPNLKGYATDDSFSHFKASGFNVGEIGAVSMDLHNLAVVLVERMRNELKEDYPKVWKMITIAIGANDICSYSCSSKHPQKIPSYHRNHLLESLRYLRANMPRAFVNVVSKPKVRILVDFSQKENHCLMMQMGMCSCFVSGVFRSQAEVNATRPMLEKMEENFIRVEEEVAGLEEFQDLEDFVVMYQPWAMETTLRNGDIEEDRSLLSFDCFHLSQKGQSFAGVSVWNNLLEPMGQKSRSWISPHKRFLCPSPAFPFLVTRKNSETSRSK